MIGAMVRLTLVLASAAALGAGVHVARLSFNPASLGVPQTRHIPPHGAGSRSPDSVVRMALVAAPFRARRTPISVRYDPVRAAEPAAPATPRPPKPALVLSGIIWGETPAAAIEGIPGIDGTRLVVRGDTIAGLRIRRIGHSEVVVEGFDTTWVLTVREVWQ